MLKRTLSFITLCCISAATTIAQPFNKAKMDSLMETIATHDKGMGSLAVAEKGELIYARAIGFKNDEHAPADINTKYRIGSITKMFTATMIFQLVEEKKLTLATTLDKFYPKIPNAKKITIGQMLSHRSGIHSFTDDSEYLLWHTKPHTQAELLDIIIKGGSDFVPDSKAEYSNSNFVLLGYIAEKLTKQSYAQAVQQRIITKAGLKNTYVGTKTNVANNEAYSYSMGEKWEQEPETDMSIPGGAGAILSTPSDLTLFITALFNNKLISKTSLDQMTTIKDGYGMGIFQIPFGAKKCYGHTGGIDGFSSSLVYFPGDSAAVAYCNNGQVMTTNDIMIGALSICFNVPYKIPDFKVVEVSENTLRSYTGVYASAAIPLKITVSLKGKNLFAQATGQGEFPLSAKNDTTFEFTQAGITMLFDAAKNEMTLKQGGGVYNFKKAN